jgi:hypothetical protein
VELSVNARNIVNAIAKNSFAWWEANNNLYLADDIFSLCVALELKAKKRDRKGMIDALRNHYANS